MQNAHGSDMEQCSLFQTPPEPRVKTVTKGQFAKILGVSPGRISQLVKDGLPVQEDGRIAAEIAKAWYAENYSPTRRKALTDDRPNSTKAELDVVKLERAKLDLELERGNLIDRFTAKRVIFERARTERDAWIGWASRASVQIASALQLDPADTFSLLDKLVRDHLADLAELPLEELTDE